MLMPALLIRMSILLEAGLDVGCKLLDISRLSSRIGVECDGHDGPCHLVICATASSQACCVRPEIANVGAYFRERGRHRQAQAARAARHESDPPVEAKRVQYLPRLSCRVSQ